MPPKVRSERPRPRKTRDAHGHTEKLSPVQNNCFVCGPDNPDGMHLEFAFDEERHAAFAHINIPKRYQGPPGHCHGGILATILDEAMGKVNKLRNSIALTKKMEVEYLAPVPLNKPLIVEGWEKSFRGRRHTNIAEIRDEEGHVLTRSVGVFIAIDPERMFKKFIEAGQYGGPVEPDRVEAFKAAQAYLKQKQKSAKKK